MLRNSLRMLALALAGLVGLVLVATPAMAGGYPPPPGITVDDPTPEAGDPVTVSGESCAIGATVTITFDGEEVATTTVQPDGTFSATFTVDDDTAPGSYEVEAAGCGPEVLSTTITVAATTVAAPVAGPALPRTGSSSTEPLVRTGAVLVAAGAVLVFAMRRRQQATIGG